MYFSFISKLSSKFAKPSTTTKFSAQTVHELNISTLTVDKLRWRFLSYFQIYFCITEMFVAFYFTLKLKPDRYRTKVTRKLVTHYFRNTITEEIGIKRKKIEAYIVSYM
jgi:hypothetical protein